MNKNKFMKILSDNLSPLSKEERENALRYYEEFFEECESEEKALEELGDPYIIAQQILSESGAVTSYQPDENTHKNNSNSKKSGSDIVWLILVLILTFPLWVGIAGGLFGILIAVIAIIFALVVSFVSAGGALLVSGTLMLFSSVPVGLGLIGLGFVSTGLLFLLVIPVSKGLWKGIVWLLNLIVKPFNKLFNRNKKEEV